MFPPNPSVIPTCLFLGCPTHRSVASCSSTRHPNLINPHHLPFRVNNTSFPLAHRPKTHISLSLHLSLSSAYGNTTLALFSTNLLLFPVRTRLVCTGRPPFSVILFCLEFERLTIGSLWTNSNRILNVSADNTWARLFLMDERRDTIRRVIKRISLRHSTIQNVLGFWIFRIKI